MIHFWQSNKRYFELEKCAKTNKHVGEQNKLLRKEVQEKVYEIFLRASKHLR